MAPPEAPEAGAPDLLSSHPAGRRRWSRPLTLVAVLVAALVAAPVVVDRVRELVPDPTWPTACGVDGRPEWCARPSAAMTDPGLAAVARAHCPTLADVPPGDLVPQPLRLLGPPGSETRARTTGTTSNGTEEALLGRPGKLSWVTREVGGRYDGRVRVSCPGAARSTPGLQLDADQFRATVAPTTEGRPRLDLEAVARELAGAARGRVSFGFLTCDTGSLDLARPQVGRTFACAVEVYGAHGLGAYRVTYRVTDQAPYFARAGSR